MIASAKLWARLAPDAHGLITAVVQHVDTKQILMVGHMNAEALAKTLEHRRVTFYSRSRQCLWEKGETSGHTLELRGLRIDCDGDAVLVFALPHGPTCHTGHTSCMFRPVDLQTGTLSQEDDGPPVVDADVLTRIQRVILERRAGRGLTNREGKSYVQTLLAAGHDKIATKIREEADELARALTGESLERVAAEAADLVFHALVGLVSRDLRLNDVEVVLEGRFGVSGIDEKSSRSDETS